LLIEEWAKRILERDNIQIKDYKYFWWSGEIRYVSGMW
jgi:hypothetical protein